MVDTEIAQLSGECIAWRAELRNNREVFSGLKQELEVLARNQTAQEALKQVEHFHNQFHIQLINIHDLKQAIKNHERQVQLQSAAGSIEEATFAEHERLLEEHTALSHSLQELRDEFSGFVLRSQ